MSVGNKGKYALSERVYDFAKESATIYIPAAVVLYVALAAIWHLPNPVEVAGTGAAVTTFLGVVLKISNTSYQNAGGSADGSVQMDGSTPSKLAIDLTPEELAGKNQIVLNVTGITTTPPASSGGSPMTPGTYSQ